MSQASGRWSQSRGLDCSAACERSAEAPEASGASGESAWPRGEREEREWEGQGERASRGPSRRGRASQSPSSRARRGARASGLQGGAGRARGAALHPEMSGEPLKALLCGSDTAGFPPTSLLGSWPWRLGEVDGAREKGGGKGRLAAAARACAAALGLGGLRGRGPRTKCVSSPFLVCLSSPFFQQTLRVPFAGGSGEAGRGGRDQGSGVCHPLLSAAPPPSLHHLLPGSPQWFPSGHPAPPLVSREPPSARQPKWSSKHEEHPTPLRCRASSGAFSELGKKHELLTRPSRRAHCLPVVPPPLALSVLATRIRLVSGTSQLRRPWGLARHCAAPAALPTAGRFSLAWQLSRGHLWEEHLRLRQMSAAVLCHGTPSVSLTTDPDHCR